MVKLVLGIISAFHFDATKEPGQHAEKEAAATALKEASGKSSADKVEGEDADESGDEEHAEQEDVIADNGTLAK